MTSTPASPTVTYLRSLGAVRDRSREVFDLIVAGKADHWDWHEDKLQTVVDFCAGLLTVRSCNEHQVADSSATLAPTLIRSLVSRYLSCSGGL